MQVEVAGSRHRMASNRVADMPLVCDSWRSPLASRDPVAATLLIRSEKRTFTPMLCLPDRMHEST